MPRRFDLSPTGRIRVYLLTVVGTLACIGIAFAVDGWSSESGRWELPERWHNNLIIPLIVAPPFFLFLLAKLRALSLAHRELMTVAATDTLTNCLNRRAFVALVDRYLDRLDTRGERGGGAFLVLDVDHFKKVNDRHGHDLGDEALKLIADTIKANVRDHDIVARLGGEEFGVFLPGLDPGLARLAAERIRAAVGAAEFAPNGKPHPLSLSIGGVTFTPPTSFSELYRNADQRLYAAKRSGRNRVDIVSNDGPAAAAVMM